VTRVRVSVSIDAPPRQVWRAIEDIATHTAWMEDAVAIRFTSSQRSGVGTAFACDTAIGPFRLTDRMEVTEWSPGRALGIRHTGLVTGTGRFTLRRRGWRAGTRFTWDERLRFPWWMGGPIGGALAAPLLRRVWRRNLANLRAQVDKSS
jgi:hypothetical protein